MLSRTNDRVHVAALLFACSIAVLIFTQETSMAAQAPEGNLLPPVEQGATGWIQHTWSGSPQFADDAPGRTGGTSFSIRSTSGADAGWFTSPTVELNAWYRLSGWIRTEGIVGATGALLNIQNMQSVRTQAFAGTQDWTRVSAVFKATEPQLQINALYGGWGQSTGQAWYDDIVLEPLADGWEPSEEIRLSGMAAGPVLSPQLFGHNLEHTRKALWTGLSAEMVANRKFAALDGCMAKRWWTLEDGGVTVDSTRAYAGSNSIRMERVGSTPHCGIWQQHDWLTFRGDANYAFRVWARSDTPQSFQIRVVTRSGFTNVFAEVITVSPGEWQLASGEFTPVCPANGAQLEIRLMSDGPLWIGAVSMMPAGNFHGMRRDVVDLLKQLKPGNLRWPGGCFAEYYNWQEGLLPVDQRPPIGPHQWVGLLPDSDGYDNHDIGTDEFIALCREIGAEPAITTRFSEGSPEEAAAWVEYCNGDAATTWGQVRASRGFPEPYDVNYWYVGNELTGMSLLTGPARTDPNLLAGMCRDHVEAMHGADPDITMNVGIPAVHTWLDPLFAEAGDLLDEVQTGFYFPIESAQEIGWLEVLHTPVNSILPGLRILRQYLDGAAPHGPDTAITYYEWNVMWDRDGNARSGLFAAEMLNMFCREAESLNLAHASYFQPVTEGAIRVGPVDSALAPDGEVFALYSAHQGHRLLDVAVDADSVISVCASLAPDGKSMFVTVVNRNETSPTTLNIAVVDFADLRRATAELLIPASAESEGGFARRTEQLAVTTGNGVTLELPRLSVAGIRLDTEDKNAVHAWTPY